VLKKTSGHLLQPRLNGSIPLQLGANTWYSIPSQRSFSPFINQGASCMCLRVIIADTSRESEAIPA
jgi:hypothetical protein